MAAPWLTTATAPASVGRGGHLGDGRVVALKELVPVGSGGHPAVEVTVAPGEDRRHVPPVRLVVRQLLQGAGLDLVDPVQHLHVQPELTAERRSGDLGTQQRGRVQGADRLIHERPWERFRLAFSEFGQPGAGVGGVQLPQHVPGGFPVADEQELHGSHSLSSS